MYDPDTERYLGLQYSRHVTVGPSRTAVLVKPEAAQRQIEPDPPPDDQPPLDDPDPSDVDPPEDHPTRFYGRKRLSVLRAGRDISDITEEITRHLEKTGEVTITVEIQANSDGYDSAIRRTVKENASQLGFEDFGFEE